MKQLACSGVDRPLHKQALEAALLVMQTEESQSWQQLLYPLPATGAAG